MPLPSPNELSSAAAALDLGFRPLIGLILGSGLGGFADSLGQTTRFPYERVPHMPRSHVQGHAGNFVGGKVGDVPVLCMQGRVHSYEGHAAEKVVFGACLLAEAGCDRVLITNAAGGINTELSPGDLMLITDHLNLSGQSPLVGPADGRGPRFPDMTAAYDPALRRAADRAAERVGVALKSGVYASMLGPTYETPAEIRMLRAMGADAVGMSTVLEVIALRQLGVRAAGMSCITNLAAGLSGHQLSHDEVEETAKQSRKKFTDLLGAWIAESAATE